MKKTININLGNQVFQIDEDAYQLLDNYLNDLKHYFRKEKESGEIIQDIEYRFAELFGEKVRLGHRVITIEIVEKTIARVGKPEELADDDGHGEDGAKPETEKPTTEKINRRFYRNPDDKLLGGVASGIAAYLNWDPIWIRLLLLALVFLKGIIVPIYILLWIIMPLARTAAQKLEMRGKRITVENIGKTVTENFGRGDEIAEPHESGVRGFFDGSLRVLGVLLKASLIVLGVILFLPLLIVMVSLLFALVVTVIALVGAAIGTPFLGHSMVRDAFSYGMFGFGNADIGTILFASGHGQGFFAFSLLTAGITIIAPIVALVYSVVVSIRKSKPLSKAVKLTSLVIWLLSLAFTVYAVIELYPAAMKIL